MPDTGREGEMYASNVLRRRPVNKGDEITGKFKEVYDEELHGMHFSAFVVRLIISRKLTKVCETYSPKSVYRNCNISRTL